MSGAPARIVILPGAHKTASTHLQSALVAARPALAGHGIAALTRAELRPAFAPLLAELRTGTPPEALRPTAARVLAALAEGAAQIVICDENLLGGTGSRQLLGLRGLYPWAPQRLAAFTALLPPVPLHLGLATRDLSGFLVSCYGEAMHHDPFQPFRDWLGPRSLGRLRWADLMARIEAALADRPLARPLLHWRYEDYPAVLPALMAALIGPEAAATVTPPPQPARIGASARALAELGRLAAAGAVPRGAFAALKRRYPKSRRYPPLAPFTEAQRARLAAIEAADRDAIAALPGWRNLP